jgi:tRNA nucleotidyltransferase (CCA-adding enzyme)
LPVLQDKSIGVILYCKFPRSLKFLILKHRKGHWSFAKGHREKGETSIETAKRELHEEAGIDDAKFISKKILLKEKYTFLNREQFEVRKEVRYYIAGTKTKRIKIDNKEIINYEWCTLKAAEKLITYKQSRKTIKKADSLITKYLKLT